MLPELPTTAACHMKPANTKAEQQTPAERYSTAATGVAENALKPTQISSNTPPGCAIALHFTVAALYRTIDTSREKTTQNISVWRAPKYSKLSTPSG